MNCREFRRWLTADSSTDSTVESAAYAHIDSCDSCQLFQELIEDGVDEGMLLDSIFSEVEEAQRTDPSGERDRANRMLARVRSGISEAALRRLANDLTKQRLHGWAHDQITGAWNRAVELTRDAFQPVARPAVAVLGRDDEDYRWVAPDAVLVELDLKSLYSEIAVEVRTGAGEPRASLIITPVEGAASPSSEHGLTLTAHIVDEHDKLINKQPMRLWLGTNMRSAPVVLARFGDPRRFRGRVRLGLTMATRELEE